MKKNISINISGIIFHIEEDGYETLRKYLDAVNKYFSSFEDSSEIMADIESRMAELFLSKLNEGKQVITAEDVSSLMATMGSVNDFKAAEEPQKEYDTPNEQAQTGERTYTASKQLLRDKKRKTLGGVCAGLGSYLNVDPVWVRLLFVLVAFGYGISIIAYIILWFVMPGSYDLEEPAVKKKMFREPSKKVLGGVAGGLAAYFGIDIILVRIIFIAATFVFGFGFITYIVLWFVLPEAKTLTDKMQMQGEPVTLSNIESTLKKNQNLAGNEDEPILTKILLLPFRLISIVLLSLSKIILPLSDVFRVGLGIFIILFGAGFLLTALISGGILVGFLSGLSLPHWFGPDMNQLGFPVEIFKNTFPPLAIFAALIFAIIPCVFIIVLGISCIAKRIVFHALAGWTLLAILFVSATVLAISIPRIIYAFKEGGEYTLEKVFTPTTKSFVLKINEVGLDDYKVTSLTLKGYDGRELKLKQAFGAQGSTRADAVENAHMVDYHVAFADSILIFDSNIQFKKGAKFRAQNLEMILYIPYNMPFVMDEDASRFITQVIDHENLEGYTWKMTENGLTCLTCIHPNNNDNDNDNEDNNDLSSTTDPGNFNAIHISGEINATITQGDTYSIEMIGTERDKEKCIVRRNGTVLVIDFNDGDNDFNVSNVKVNITVPSLKQLDLKGAGKVTLDDLQADNLAISVQGAVIVKGDLDVKNLSIQIEGSSFMTLSGHGENMKATVIGASWLDADNYEVVDATVEAEGVSHINVNATGRLDMKESFTSDVDYVGEPHVVKR